MITDRKTSDADELLVSAAEFVRIDLAARYDTSQGTPRKLRQYQDWLRFHLSGTTPTPALLHVDLRRLEYLRSLGASATGLLRGPGKNFTPATPAFPNATAPW